MNLTLGRLVFGEVLIEWYLPLHMTPIGVWHEGLNGSQVYCQNCDLHYTICGIHRVVPMFVDGERFTFDGASIPWWLRWLPGFSPLGWHVWAVIIHDFGCDHPDLIPRHIADAFFIEILKAIRPDKYWQAVALAAGVRFWTVTKLIAGHVVAKEKPELPE